MALTGPGTPNQMRQFVKDGTVKAFALWNRADLGYVGAALASGQITGAQRARSSRRASWASTPSGRKASSRAPAPGPADVRKAPTCAASASLRVRPDRLEKYRRRHAAVWPEMLVALRDAGWHDYSLFVGDDGLLVGVFRTEDLDAARAALDATEVNASGSARWPRSSSTCPPGAPDTGIRVLDEVFDLDSQPARIAAAPG